MEVSLRGHRAAWTAKVWVDPDRPTRGFRGQLIQVVDDIRLERSPGDDPPTVRDFTGLSGTAKTPYIGYGWVSWVAPGEDGDHVLVQNVTTDNILSIPAATTRGILTDSYLVVGHREGDRAYVYSLSLQDASQDPSGIKVAWPVFGIGVGLLVLSALIGIMKRR